MLNIIKAIISITSMVLLGASCAPEPAVQEDESRQLIDNLERAEMEHDIDALGGLFAEDAVIYVPDSMPFAGKSAITALFEYLWNQREDQKVDYHIETTEETDGVP